MLESLVFLKHKNKVKVVLALLSLLVAPFAIAGTASSGLSGVAEQVESQIRSIANLLVIVSYVAGVGFALGGVIKFKSHRDNPTQVPLSAPIVLLAVGACLLFLPNILEIAGQTVFGTEAQTAADGLTGTTGF